MNKNIEIYFEVKSMTLFYASVYINSDKFCCEFKANKYVNLSLHQKSESHIRLYLMGLISFAVLLLFVQMIEQLLSFLLSLD